MITIEAVDLRVFHSITIEGSRTVVKLPIIDALSSLRRVRILIIELRCGSWYWRNVFCSMFLDGCY